MNDLCGMVQAFGVGDDEDEDDREIYSSRDMTAYDHELGGPEPDDNYGWTAPGRQAPAATSWSDILPLSSHKKNFYFYSIYSTGLPVQGVATYLLLNNSTC